MAEILFLSFFLMCFSTVTGWTYTAYYTTDGEDFLGASGSFTSIYTIQVYPTGPVTATSTATSTTLLTWQRRVGDENTAYPITVTALFLSPNASVCGNFYDESCTLTGTTGSNPSIDTSFYAPIVISAPSSCTKTSFLYTTSRDIFLNNLDQNPSTDLSDQATESSEALFITTYVYTLSTDLGGQPETTTRCDIYLRDGAILGLEPSHEETYYMNQCVDPRRYMCTSSSSTVPAGACPITGGLYPPAGQTGSVGDTSVAPAAPTSKSGVGGSRELASQGFLLLMLPMSVLVLSILCWHFG